MGKLCSFIKTPSSAMQSTPDWSDCISWMDETIKHTPTTTPTPGWQRSSTVFPPPETKTFQLEDGSIRIEVGDFWKVVSSWHLVDTAENQLIAAYRAHHT
jgi:hypothetical protein